MRTSSSSLAPLQEAEVTTREEVHQYARAMVRRVVDDWEDLAREFDRIDAECKTRETERQ